jgi:hypothetical protein
VILACRIHPGVCLGALGIHQQAGLALPSLLFRVAPDALRASGPGPARPAAGGVLEAGYLEPESSCGLQRCRVSSSSPRLYGC